MSEDPGTQPTGQDAPEGSVRRFSSQFSLLVSSGLFGYAGVLLLNLVLVRRIGAAAFGAWALAYGVMRLIAALSLLGADWMVLRQGSYYQGIGDTARLRTTIHFSLSISAIGLLCVSALVYVVAPTIASSVIQDPSLAPMLRLAALAAPALGLRQVLLYATQTFKDVRVVALVANVLQPIAYLVLIGAAVALEPSETAAFSGAVAAEAILTCVAVLALHRRIALLGTTKKVNRRELIHFALPAWGSGIVERSRGNIFSILLGSLTNVANVGVLFTADRVSQAARAINMTMNRVYTPMASDLFLRDKREELATLAKNVGRWTFTLCFPLTCVMMVFAEEILSVFGDSFRQGAPLMRLLGLGVLFLCGTGPVTTTLIVAGRSRLNLLNYLIVVTAEVGTAVWLIPRLGLTGAAIALLVGRALNNIMPLFEVWAILGFHVYRRDYWKPVIAGLSAVAIAKLVTVLLIHRIDPTAAFVGLGVTGLAYVALLLVFGLGREDRVAIRALIGRSDRQVLVEPGSASADTTL